jgi:hypothetical protein
MKTMRVINKVVLNVFLFLFVVIFIGEALSDDGALDLSTVELISLIVFSGGLIIGSFVIWVNDVTGAFIIIATVIILNILFIIVEGQITLQIDFGLLLALGLLQLFLVWVDSKQKV